VSTSVLPLARPGAPAWRPLAGTAGAVAAALVLTSGGYGYHRDELYFLRAGRHLAFGYADQPPLTPLVARAASELFGESLVGLRLASALAAGLVVLLTGLLARELGGGRAAQVLAAACMGVSAYLLAVGHLLSTSTFDLLAWTALCWLLVRALRNGGPTWLAVGAVAGVALQNKALPAFLLAAVVAGLLVVGPRAPLLSPYALAGGAVALIIWAPHLAWQAAQGWPQLALSRAIAAGSSGTSEPWWLLLPFQLVLVGPLLVPVWAIGWWRLARDPALRPFRAFALAYPLLAAVFLLTGGKPYYLAGMYPVLLAAGAAPVVGWVRAGARGRAALLGAALAVTGAVNAVLVLPLVPVQHLADTPIVDIRYDTGETVGWPALVRTVADVHGALPAAERATTVVLTRNYGQAGAVDRFGPRLGLPTAYSGHNSYADWGPPPETAGTVIVVGYGRAELERWCGRVELAARVDNGIGVDNDEQGTPVWTCRDRRVPWAELWPDLRRLG
jgi:hypothetical protein